MQSLDANQIRSAAVNQWRGILEHAGMDNRLLTNKHTACPICGGKDRFRFDDKDGRGTFICNQCRAGDGFKLLELWRGGGFPDALAYVAQYLGYSQDSDTSQKSAKKCFLSTDKTDKKPTPDRKALITTIWQAANNDHPLLVSYLEKRGCQPAVLPVDVRLHPSLAYWHDGALIGHFPALVALVRDTQSQVKGLQRIYLTPDGTGKADVPGTCKKLLSLQAGSTKGCAVQLYPSGYTLALTEGIETALAVRCALPSTPVWAAVTANHLAALHLPDNLKTLLIFADLDRSNTGEKVAYQLAERANTAGIQCKIMLPTEADARRVYAVQGRLGKSVDWLDVWNCEAIAQAGEAA